MGYTLRVSVLEQCQLRCSYCLPLGSRTLLRKNHWLSLSQYDKIARAMKPLSIDKVRFTGGEPLLRRDLPAIIEVFSRVFVNQTLAVTTNGQHFCDMKNDLIQAGLTAVTFHLDTLKKERYRSVMGNGDVMTVQQAIDQALKASLNVKLNVVVQKGINDDELIDFLTMSKITGVKVRFIELMNTGSATDFVKRSFLSGAAILKKIGEFTEVVSVDRPHKSSPAEEFLAKDLATRFGLIASDTRPFCTNCNRLRLTADGRLRTCLYEPLGHALKCGAIDLPDDDELVRNIALIVAQKTSFHPALKKSVPSFSMSEIGG